MALLAIALASADQRDERLQRIAGAADPGRAGARPVSAVVVTVLAFVLIMWLHAGDAGTRITRFTDVLLLVGYWIPGVRRDRGRGLVDAGRRAPQFNPATEPTAGPDAAAAVVAFVPAYGAAVPFMNTSLIQGPVARAWHGADVAYFVNFAVALVLYGGWRVISARRKASRR